MGRVVTVWIPTSFLGLENMFSSASDLKLELLNIKRSILKQSLEFWLLETGALARSLGRAGKDGAWWGRIGTEPWGPRGVAKV